MRRDRPLLQRRVRRGRLGHRHGRERCVPRLLEPQGRVRAHQLAPGDGDLILPGERHQQDVPQVPGVLVLADPGRSGAPRRLVTEPLREGEGRAMRRLDGACELGRRAGDLAAQLLQHLGLFLEGSNAAHPEVACVGPGEIHARLAEERRHRAQLRGESRGLLDAERARRVEHRARPDRVLPEPDRAMDSRPFLGRRVALVRAHRGVVGRVTREGLEDGEMVAHAIHLGAHEVPIHLLRDAPSRRVDRGESSLHRIERGEATRIRRRRVVRDTVEPWRLFEGAPIGEEREELRVGGRARRGHGPRADLRDDGTPGADEQHAQAGRDGDARQDRSVHQVHSRWEGAGELTFAPLAQRARTRPGAAPPSISRRPRASPRPAGRARHR
jgi:hypothetical protein